MRMFGMRVLRAGALVGVLAGLLTVPAPAAAQVTAGAPQPTLVAIRAAHHPGMDRLVFEFRGPLPAWRSAQWVKGLVADPSGLQVPVVGSAVLKVRFAGATGHDRGVLTYGATRRTFALPGVIQVVNTGDFESVLSFGVGVAKKSSFRMHTLRDPSRVIIDIKTPYRTVNVRTHFLNSANFNIGRTPYGKAVQRPVIASRTAFGALQRLFAGLTQAERDAGLYFVTSKATGFSKVTVKGKVARVYLTGGCASDGSTFTIADEIMPTLKQFPSIRWVKIYDPTGKTQQPEGRSDSIPTCLEP
ncbi:AMIN-like domain-containing (lipo)protein [Acrocarpospora catenulata]|uniref:AMIN-like domain-containing (lipo)protein n=1 Tax=Acrocarpospora catenulata TaxID=2836182 RepID=UPI001BD9D09D|nr:hypothetical protein [Acrocarpospora catenulata]